MNNSNGNSTSAGGGTLYLILIQVVSRGLTFIGNQILLRYLSPNHLGLAIQLEALSISILYTARESLRVALQRQPLKTSAPSNPAWRKLTSQTVVNLAYLAVFAGTFLSYFWGSWYLYQAHQEVLDSADFWLAFRLYMVATFAELASEPCFVAIQQRGLFQVRARAETIGAITRCLSSCLTALIMARRNLQFSVLPFAVGQLCYALTLCSAYFTAANALARSEQFSLLLRKVAPTSAPNYYLALFSKPLLDLAGAFYGQSVFKWLLTQGDTLVLSLFADLQAQGVFALASNYGGLVSRLLFQPIEESSRNYFGQLLSAFSNPARSNTTSGHPVRGLPDLEDDRLTSTRGSDSNTMSTSNSNTTSNPRLATNNKGSFNAGVVLDPNPSSTPASIDSREWSTIASSNPNTHTQDANIHNALAHLTTILHGYLLLIALPCFALLPHLFPLLVRLLLGPTSRWSTPETFSLLAIYSYYIPCLAVNGILDAFVTSVATEAQLGLQSILMVVVTIVYLSSAWLAMQWFGFGAVGLVGANILGMILRILFSLWFIRGWIIEHVRIDGRKEVRKLVRDSFPNIMCVASAVAGAVLLQITSSSGDANLVLPDAGKASKRGLFLARLFDLQALRKLSTSVPLDKFEKRLGLLAQNDLLVELGNILAAAIFLGVSILVLEREFLSRLVEPLLPGAIKGYVLPYLKPQAQKTPPAAKAGLKTSGKQGKRS